MPKENVNDAVEVRETEAPYNEVCKICSTPHASHPFKGGHICGSCLDYIRSNF
ncbi:MAG: hypothetical protein PWQ12_918 [Clostridiales bacterium]|jgi:hypothetical protein|nr:hypothetical protein [Clostridiales bacterium]